MARPLKKGLGYFPLDTNMLSDRKIQRLVHRYGCKGICTYLTVLCEIYGERGYYIPYNDDFCFDIAFTLGLGEEEVVADMHARYGNAEKFLNTFNPDMQVMAARYMERAYFGTAPSLETVCAGYGEQAAIVWNCIELENINLFAGVKDKMPVNRQQELSRLILAEYPYLKVTELLLFYHRLKCGRYDRFYGMVDAHVYTPSGRHPGRPSGRTGKLESKINN